MVLHTGLVGSFICGHLNVPPAQICSRVTKKCVLAGNSHMVI